MIIDKHEVNYKPSGPHQCDKIGVTYTAFKNQHPAGCRQKKGAEVLYWDRILHNQSAKSVDCMQLATFVQSLESLTLLSDLENVQLKVWKK